MPVPAIINVSDASFRHLEGEQANDVRIYTANGDGALGNTGEKRGFAKLRYDTTDPDQANALADVTEASSRLYEPGKEMYKNKGGEDGDRALLARSVASTRVDAILGTNSLCQEGFASNGQGQVMGISIEVDGAGIRSNWSADGGPAKSSILDIDYTDPDIQRGLSDLQVLDYVTGQTDRHMGNIMVDPSSKQVHGIDNDLAFPERNIDDIREFVPKIPGGVPKQIHEETAARILEVDPDEMAQALRDMEVPKGCTKLSEAEINGARERLIALQNAIRNPQAHGVQIVKEFNNDTYDQAVAEQSQAFVAARRWNKDPGVPNFGSRQDNPDALVYAALPENEVGKKESRHTPVLSAILRLDTDLNNTPATSYLGAVVIEQKRNELGRVTDPERFGVRPVNSVGKAQRSPVAIDQKIDALKQERAALEAKLAGYNKRLEKLESPDLPMRLRSLRYGGVESAREAFLGKEAKVTARLREIDQQIGVFKEHRLEASPELKEVQGRIASLRERNDALKQAAQAHAEEAALSPQQLNANQTEIDALADELNAQLELAPPDPDAIAAINTRLDEVAAGIENSEGRLHALEAPIVSNRARMDQANAELAQQQSLQQSRQNDIPVNEPPDLDKGPDLASEGKHQAVLKRHPSIGDLLKQGAVNKAKQAFEPQAEKVEAKPKVRFKPGGNG